MEPPQIRNMPGYNKFYIENLSKHLSHEQKKCLDPRSPLSCLQASISQMALFNIKKTEHLNNLI